MSAEEGRPRSPVPLIVKFREEQLGGHLHVTWFVGVDADHLQNAGTLVLKVDEWQLVGTAVELGARLTQGQLTCIAGEVVHILSFGFSLCGLGSPPSLWPKEHKWVDSEHSADATCVRCLKIRRRVLDG